MNWFTFFCLMIVFIVSPFQWGLFFEQNIQTWEWITFVLFITNLVWYFIKEPQTLIRSRVYYFVFLIPLMYAASAVSAINPTGNGQTFIRFLMYACFFLLLVWTKQSLGRDELFSGVFHILGLIFLSFAILNFYGFIRFDTLMVGCYPGRACGPFRYPNAFGSVMGAYWFITFATLIYSVY